MQSHSIPICWRWYRHQEPALKALQQSKIKSPEKQLFAFQTTASGSMVYVLEDPHVVGRVVLGQVKAVSEHNQPFIWSAHCFEHLADHETPMILYADCEYMVAANKDLDPTAMITYLIRIVRRVVMELLIANQVTNPEERAERLTINVETSHRPEKVSFHLKIPQLIVEDMHEQQAFWLRVFALIEQEQEQGNPEALQQRVFKELKKLEGSETIQESFSDMSVYNKTQNQLFRTLAAAKMEKDRDKALHFLVPEGAPDRASITLEQWLSSLILRPFATEGVVVPEAWRKKSHFSKRGSVSSSSFSVLMSRNDDGKLPDHLQVTSSKLLQEIDAQWCVDPIGIKITTASSIWDPPSQDSWSFSSTSTALSSERITTVKFSLAPTTSCYCPLKGGHHDSNAA